MLENPFAILERRLNRLEELLLELGHARKALSQETRIGSIALAQELTGLSRPRIYALVTEKDEKKRMPVMRRGNRLFFDRDELLAWIKAGKRGANETAADA